MLRFAGELADGKGWKIYLVGGAVRDLLLGERNIDLDLLVERYGLEFSRELAARRGGTVKTYRRFATAMVIVSGIKIDVTTTRREDYPRPGALPRVLPGSLKEDLLRRDFTINAMALSLNRRSWGMLVDPWGGRADLEAGIIRVLHAGSFRDDPTRIFRAVRFQKRLGFRIEPGTEELIRTAVDLKAFEEVSPERLRRELELMLAEPGPEEAIAAMARYDQLRFIHPELSYGDRQKRILNNLEGVWKRHGRAPERSEVRKWRLYFFALVWPLSPAALIETGRRFNFPRNVIRSAAGIRSREEKFFAELGKKPPLPPSMVYRRLSGLHPEVLLLAAAAAPSRAARERIESYLDDWSKVSLEIGGGDLAALGLKPGAAMGRALREVLYARLDGKVDGREEELEFARKLVDRAG